MGWIFSLIKIIIKITIVIFSTLFLQAIGVFLLNSIPISTPIARLVQLVATACFFLALFVFVFGRSIRGMKWPLIFGFGLIVFTLLIGSIMIGLLLITINPNLQFLFFGDLLFATVILLFMNPKWLRPIYAIHQRILFAAIEVHPDSAFNPQTKQPFKHILSNLATTRIPMGFRCYRLPSGHTRLFFYTWATQQEELKRNHTRLHQLLQLHFSNITFSPCELPPPPLPSNTPFAMIHLTGSPCETVKGFSELTRTNLIQVAFNSQEQYSRAAPPAMLFQVTMTPTYPDKFERCFVQRKVDQQVHEATQLINAAALLVQGLAPPPKMISKLEDPKAIERAHKVLRQIRFFQAQQLLRTQVSIICWHPTEQQIARGIVQSIGKTATKAIPATTSKADVKIHTVRVLAKQKLKKLLEGSLTAPSTILNPSEAAIYLEIPPLHE